MKPPNEYAFRDRRQPRYIALALRRYSALALIALASRGAIAQSTVRTAVSLFTGFATGLVVHETGHLIAGTVLDAHPGTKSISYAGIPFFAVTHRDVPPRKEFVISSAGLWMQHIGSEWLLTARPQLRHEHAPFLKGLFVFNVGTSVMYAGAAVLRTGPPERDPRSMAASLGSHGWPEPTIGALMLAPALLDGYRFFHPEQRWAEWTSRGLKVACAALTLAASSHRESARSLR
ncbi:MAG: hypothetical protein ABIT38_23515 [Gemmatimonadaceae bacterium]